MIIFACGTILKAPDKISECEVSHLAKTTPIHMTWSGKVPDSKLFWELSYSHYEHKGQLQFSKTETAPHIAENMGCVAKPLVILGQIPQTLDTAQLAKKLTDKKVVIYTGAGISTGVVPNMAQLMQILNLEHMDPLSYKPSTLQHDALKKFGKMCLYGPSTPAHISVAAIVQARNWGLMTENLDLLHQRSGVKTLAHMDADWLAKHISAADLQKIDIVLTIGLKSDESGFLAWYKQHNPQGTIIAININSPNYLSHLDYFVHGDVQDICPKLEKLLIQDA